MTLKERALYHQIHPIKLVTDIVASIVSLYFFWHHQLTLGFALHYLPPTIASYLLVRSVDLEKYRSSQLGRYISTNMTRTIELLRLFGDFVTILGAWYQDWLLVAAGFTVVVGAWCNGLLPRWKL